MTTTKKLITVAVVLIAIGAILFSFTACAGGGLKSVFEGVYETNTVDIADSFNDIDIEINTADVQFLISEDDKCHVVARDHKNINYDVKVVDGVLKISVHDDREWYDFVSIGIESSSLTVYLPEVEYGNLTLNGSTCEVILSGNFKFESIDVRLSTGDIDVSASATGNVNLKASTGDIELSNMSAASVSLTVSTGSIEVENVDIAGDATITVSTGDTEIDNMTCNNLFSEGGTGDIEMEDVIAAGKMTIVRSTGEVTLYACDAAELDIETGTGDVKGVLLTSKVFITRTNTGKIEVPETVEGGKCKVVTTTGRISFAIADSEG